MAKMTDNRYFGDPRGAKARRRLFARIEKLEGNIRMNRELIALKEKQLAEKREQLLQKRAAQLARPLDRQGLQIAEPEAAAEAQFLNMWPAMEKRQRLVYRKLRQDLRRKEQLLDKNGALLPGASLSEQAQQELYKFEAAQQKERDLLKKRLLEKAGANRPGAAEAEAARIAHAAALGKKDEYLSLLRGELEKKDQARLEAYRERKLALIGAQQKTLSGLQATLIESDKTARHNLPEDVVLRLDKLSMTFGGLKAVDNLSFDVKKGEIFGLIGPNGAGKTTVFNCITQFYKPTGGNLLYRTHEGNVLQLNNYQVHNIIAKGIVRTFQNVEVIAELSILENLLIAAHKQFRSSLFSQMFNTRRVREEEQVIRERAMQVLDYCGLTALKDYPPVGQPYGVLKRIELARTLMAGANLIILDEPAAGLNDQETIELTHLIRRIQKDYKATIFLVEHNMGLVMGLCDHICAISFGRKLAYGTPSEIQNDPAVQEAYLGTSDTHELEAL